MFALTLRIDIIYDFKVFDIFDVSCTGDNIVTARNYLLDQHAAKASGSPFVIDSRY